MRSARRLGLPVAALVWSLGCGSTPEAQAPTVEAPDDGCPFEHELEHAAPRRVVMAPPPGQAGEVALVRHALATPPAVDAFEATGPTPDEREVMAPAIDATRKTRTMFTAAQKDPAQRQSALESCKQAVALGCATSRR